MNQDQDSLIQQANAVALQDFQQQSAKYYFNTNTIAPQEFVEKCKKYNIKVITRSCILDKYDQIYNEKIDQLFKKEHKITIKSLL